MTMLQAPYLRVQRDFPSDDLQKLAVEVDKSYIDTAARVNDRIIGLYALNFQVVTGEQWYLTGQPTPQQTLRQIYTFTAVGSIPHGINFTTVTLVSPRSYGSYTDGTNWYGVIYASSVAIAGQVSFYVTPTNIVVQAGAGAPAITSGTIILEWLSQF
jgi:hypothetical protein